MKTTVFFISLLIFPLTVWSQSKITFEELNKYDEDYTPGTPVFFKFENTGTENLALLIEKSSNNCKVSFPRSYILPGKTDSIEVAVFLNSTGSFTEAIQITTNQEIVTLTFSGIINDLMSCPDYNNTANKQAKKVFVVQDGTTKDPISGANIKIEGNKKRFGGITRNNGTFTKNIPPGMYRVQVNAKYYKPKIVMIPVGDGNPYILELYKNQTDNIADENTLPIEDTIQKTDSTLLVQLEDINLQDTNKVSIQNEEDSILENLIVSIDSLPDGLPDQYFSENNIVFLLDISVSMKSDDKFEYLKQSIEKLVEILRPTDLISIITFATESEIIAESIPGNLKDTIHTRLNAIRIHGRTYGITGLETAYKLAESKFIPNGNNQVILATDGGFNSPDFSDFQLRSMIKKYSRRQVKLSILGYGKNPEHINRMKEMSGYSSGNYIHVAGNETDFSVLINEIREQSLKANINNN